MTDTFTVLPFPTAPVGRYVGLIERDALTNADLGGRVDLTVTPTGSYTGTLRSGTLTQSFRGTLLTPPGHGSHPLVKLVIARRNNLPLEVTLDLDGADDSLSGTVSELGASAGAAVAGWRNPWTASNLPAQQGLHAAVFELNPAGTPAEPQGHGYCTVTVNPSGGTTVKGMTADGASILSSGFMGPAGEVILSQLLYANKGSILGDLTVAIDAARTVTGSLSWQRTLASRSVRDYPPFGPLTVEVSGGKYEVSAPILGLMETNANTNNAYLVFSGGGVESSTTNPDVSVWISNTNAVTLPPHGSSNPGKISSLKLNVATGAFSGRLTLTDAPHAPRLVDFKGQLVPTKGKGYGYFLLPQLPDPLANPPTTKSTSPILSGRVYLQENP
jgi:hypothetical protein